jgi:hypothetical protein
MVRMLDCQSRGCGFESRRHRKIGRLGEAGVPAGRWPEIGGSSPSTTAKIVQWCKGSTRVFGAFSLGSNPG